MTDKLYNVLFLCTGNSARSIIAECILNRLGQGRFKAFSAGSHPAGKVNPNALALLKRLNYPTDALRSKSWDEFAAPSPIVLDFVFTVCDNAAGEICPVWPGQPMTAHWGIPDPVAVVGRAAEIALAFSDTHRMLQQPHFDLPQPAARQAGHVEPAETARCDRQNRGRADEGHPRLTSKRQETP